MTIHTDSVHLCWHPTTILIVDDNKAHLKMYQKYLESEGMHCDTYTDPKAALKLLNQETTSNYWMRFIEQIHEQQEPVKLKQLIFKISDLYKMIYSFDRFKDISVACFDKQMPITDGVQVLKEISRLGTRCIMITGYHDSQDVIELISQQLIDAYLQKQDENIAHALVETIKNSQNIYFSMGNRRNALQSPLLPILFKDLNYVNLHNKIQQQYNIVEYYTADEGGSCIMLDADGKCIILAIIHKDEVDAYNYEIKFSEIEPDKDIVEAVKSATKAPFFLNINRSDLPPNEWRDYLIPIRLIPSENFYYAVLEDVAKYGIETEKIKSYNAFLEMQGK